MRYTSGRLEIMRVIIIIIIIIIIILIIIIIIIIIIVIINQVWERGASEAFVVGADPRRFILTSLQLVNWF